MKKFIYSFSAILLVLTSCSKDDVKNSSEDTVLVKKIEISRIDPVSNSTIAVTYNGNKIVQIVEGDEKTVFYYTGDLITKKEFFEQGLLSDREEFTYLNNKLSSLMTTSFLNNIVRDKEKSEYKHNSDGTVDYNNYEINIVTGSQTSFASGKFTFFNGNIVKDENTSSITTYEYDNKNNPLKNVLGLNKLLDPFSTLNNIVKYSYSQKNSSTTYTTVNEYIYNNINYPTEVKLSENGKLTSNEKFIY